MSDFFMFSFLAVIFATIIIISYVIPGSKMNDFFDVIMKTFPEGHLEKTWFGPNEYIVPFHSFSFTIWIDPGGKNTPRKTCFSISMPDVHPFAMRIESYRFFWEKLEDLDRKGLLERTTCETKDTALQALKYDKEFLQAIYQLVLLGDVQIYFSKTHFQVQIPELFSERKDALQFISNCLKIFQKCGQVVYPKLAEWQSPDMNCDFWSPDFVPNIFEDKRLLIFPPGELEEEMAAIARAAKKRKLLGNEIVPEKFVLCSVCFEKFDGDIVRCPVCGAGHHRRCAGGNCGECQASMQPDEVKASDAFSSDIPPFEDRDAQFELDSSAPARPLSVGEAVPMLLEGTRDIPRPEALLPEQRPMPMSSDVHAGQREDAPQLMELPAPAAVSPSRWQPQAPLSVAPPSAPAMDQTADELRLPENFGAQAGIDAPTDFGRSEFGMEARFGAFNTASAFASSEPESPEPGDHLGQAGMGDVRQPSSEVPREESFEEMLERLRRSV